MGNVVERTYYESQCGVLQLASFEDKLCLCDWLINKHRESTERKLQKILNAKFENKQSYITQKAVKELDEYFLGKRKIFDLELFFIGTEFQKKVWQALLTIPYAKTISYGELAKILKIPNSSRAIANANGANAISIFIPCHRVIGGDKSLTGYAGGIDAKRTLLELEFASRNII